MIDIENEVLTIIYNAVHPTYEDVSFESTLNLSPSVLPCVCAEEIENSSYTTTEDSQSNENHAQVTYEVSVFTNNVSGKKALAKAILALIDNALLAHGFYRITKSPKPLDDGTKLRMVARYRAVVSKDNTIYRR